MLAFDLNGTVVMDDLTKGYAYATGGDKNTPSKSMEYIATAGIHRTAIIDREGNVVLEGKKGEHTYALVNRDGTRGVLSDEEGIRVYALPGKEPVRRYGILQYPGGSYWRAMDISADGRYLAVSGTSTDESLTGNFFVIDLQENRIWQTTKPEKTITIWFTWNGENLFVSSCKSASGPCELSCYELY